MNASPEKQVKDLYQETADSYASMMDSEIGNPLYADILGRLAERISAMPGAVLDTSCGSGHMLEMYHDRYDSQRSLLGVDLTPNMVSIAQSRLGSAATIVHGDMRRLPHHDSDSVAAILSHFSFHHLNPDGIVEALCEWHRVLEPGGQLLVATWEGKGPIDYGESADIIALRYTAEELCRWIEKRGFRVDRCVVEPVDEMDMDAIYLEGTKE